MNTSNSTRLAFMVLGLVVVATAAANAQQRFAPPQQSSQHAKLGIQTTFQQYGISNGVVANFGERINNVRLGSPAARTGLEAGDIIVGYYLGNRYRKISRQSNLKFAISAARGMLRVKVINYRNGQYVNATIRFYAGSGQSGNGHGKYGNGTSGPVVHDHRGNGHGGYGNGTSGPVVHDHRDFTKFVPYPTTPPPAAPQLQIPAARAGYVWIRGHYKWNKKGGSYNWVRGHWEGAKANKAAWTPGKWSNQGHRWVWTPGRWTKVGPTITGTRR